MAHPIPSAKSLKIIEHVEGPRAFSPNSRRVPMIRMRGEWLEENGFVAGERVVVTIEQGRIVLTLASQC